MTEGTDHQMTEIYCFVDDYLKAHPRQARWRRSPHCAPRFSDAEVITLGLLQGSFQVATLKQTYGLVRANFRSAFPHLPSYAEWLRRLHQLTIHVGLLLEATSASDCHPAFYLIDSKPIPLCHHLRHQRVRLLREDGARFGKTSKGWFFGFKLHALRHITGRFLNIVLTPASYDDRAPLLALAEGTDGGILLGDLGYRGQPAAQTAQEAELLLLTRADAPARKFLLSQVRQAIETSFSQLWHRFIDRVFSRSWDGLWNTVKLKVLFYNIRHAGVVSV
jgi:Transposase DDE domain